MFSLELLVFVGAQLIATIICLPPLIIQIQQRNTACSILILSTAALTFMYAVNALIWNSEDVTTWWDGRIFCDVQIRLSIALELSITGSVACVFRQVSLLFHDAPRVMTRAQKRWTSFVEVMLCMGLPAIRMITFYIVQPDRYLILRVRGCEWTMDASWLGVLLMYVWAPVISLVALVYAALTTVRMLRHLRSTRAILGQTGSPQNKSRIIRLCIFAIALLVTTVPIQVWLLYSHLPPSLEPFSWSRVHPPNWSERIWKISQLTDTTYPNLQYLYVLYSCGLAIVVCLTPESLETLKTWLAGLRDWIRRVRIKSSTMLSRNDNLSSQSPSAHHRQLPSNYELAAMSDSRQDPEAA